MKRVRDHVQILVSNTGIAKGTEEIEEKVKAELDIETPDPVEAKQSIEANLIDHAEVKTKKPKKLNG